ncbi:PREDICTED: uncharacterized protein LOC18595465 isoform X1 [Theobroma cacao]|uniref:Uncharacterized protein LOC18595465 isoform X1 n=1 Tax=Theobroma cacao TaxID=3641 RepID=A0AB32WJK0_THECC|nr:PREDICTED: uncharacterized protein LOC18595465 isoform X1 [Theobroma cacao]
MMLKFFPWFMFFLCTTALSCWKLEGFPTLESPDFNLSDPAVRGQEIHVLRHAGLNRTVGLEANGDKEVYEKKHDIFLSEKSQRGKGAYGGANIAHRPRQAKSAASSLVRPAFFLSTTVSHVSLTVILAFPSLLLKLF